MKLGQDDPLRSSDVRQHNQNIILSKIYDARKTGISQSELVQETGLKAPTVFRIFTALEEEKLIESTSPDNDAGSGPAKKGRKPISYTVIRDARFSGGLEFWSACVSLGIFNFWGDRIYSKIENLPSNISIDRVIDIICKMVKDALASLKIDKNKMIGLGVAAPGQVNVAEGKVVYYPRIQGMRDFPLIEVLEERLRMDVYAHNNCSAMALSEYRYGGFDHDQSMFVFLLRSGVNGSFIDEKGIFVTSRSETLETGHIPIDSRGPLCSCGMKGCLQSYLFSLDPDLKDETALFSSLSGGLAENGKDALKTVHRAAEYLFTAMKTIMRFFSPRSFLIISASEIISESIAGKIRTKYAEEPDPFISEIPRIFSRAYDPVITQRGASDLVISRYFS